MSESNETPAAPRPAAPQAQAAPSPPASQPSRPIQQAQKRPSLPPLQNVGRTLRSNSEPTRFTADGLDRAADRRSLDKSGD